MEETGNKTIAKNTLILYMRSIIMMLIGLFTSRVILDTLGITDFGVYNAVCGVMALTGIISASLSNATSRFITFSIGRDIQEEANRTFANIKAIYYVLAFVFTILGETIGLWFLYHYLVIPPDRIGAATWVFHFSVASCFLSLICVPYNSAIVAHERMAAFAYISIFDVSFKLLVAYLLYISPVDKLILYASLLFGIGILKRIIYTVYCRKRFEEVRVRPKIDKQQFKEILAFAGWTLNGNIAWMGYTQGLNILLNMFFGPVVNAARGVALQVQGIITQFITNFQTALNPQLTKNYAANNLERMHQLLHFGTKFSFFLLLLLTLPVFFEAPFVLSIWLVEVPDYTVSFLQLILVHSLLETISNPLNISIHATGNIRKFQIIEGSMLLTIVPISYICLKYGHSSPSSVFIVLIIVQGLTNIARILIVLPQIKDSITTYIHQVLLPIISVCILAPILPCIAFMCIYDPILNFFVVCIISIFSVVVFTILCGLTSNERELLMNKILLLKNKYGQNL